MTAYKVSYYNRIAIGIYLLFLDVVLKNEKIGYEKDIWCKKI